MSIFLNEGNVTPVVDVRHCVLLAMPTACRPKLKPVIWLLYFLCLLLVLLGLALWMPVRLELDTEQEIYQVQWRGIFKLWAETAGEQWHWWVQVLFWKIELKSTTAPKATSKPKKPTKKSRRNLTLKQLWALAKGSWKAVHLEYLRVNWDTDDFLLNAWLYPAFQAASRGQRQLRINFQGEQNVAICLQTRPWYLIMVVVRVLFFTKK